MPPMRDRSAELLRADGPPSLAGFAGITTSEATLGGARLEKALLSMAIVVNVLVALSAGHFPYHDSTNHLARYVLLEQAWFRTPVPWVTVQLVPTPYIGVDMLGVGLVHVFGPEGAERVLAVLPLLLLPAGLYALLRVTAPTQRGWSLLGVLFSFSWWYVGGGFNYAIGLGLVCFALAAWWPNRGTGRWGIRLLLTLAAVLLLFTHLFMSLVMILVVGLDCVLDIVARWNAGARGRHLFTPQVLTVFAIVAGVGLVWTWMWSVAAESPIVAATLVPRTVVSKVKNLASPFYVFSLPQFGVMVAGYAVAAAGLVAQNRRERLLNPFVVSAAACLGMYWISPRTWNIDLRWLPAAYLLPFCMPTEARRLGRPLLLLLFGFCLAHALTVKLYSNVIRRELSNFDQVLHRLPPSARVLPLVSDRQRFRVRPYFHYALWHTIRTSSRVAGLFSREGVREGDATYWHLNHFRVHPSTYFPLYEWAIESFDPLDCARVRRDYDVIVQAGQDPRASRLIERCASESFRIGEITAYQVTTRQVAVPGP